MLTEQQLKDIEKLQEVCEEHGCYRLKLNDDMLRSRTHNKDDYFYYERDVLIGYLGLYGFGSSYELCGMVHPDFRRRGIFSSLFHQAVSSLKERRINKLLINSPGSSLTGKAFTSSLPAPYSFSEYQMKWKPRDLEPVNEDIQLAPVTKEDRGLILELDYLCFNVGRDDSMEFMEHVQQEAGNSSFVIKYKGRKSGKIHIQREQDRSYIFGFAVHPSLQGRGIGSAVLAKTVHTESMAGRSIYLEVAAKNDNALKLYEKAGFVSYQVQDYFVFEGL
ncbi:GNAT family N-acetyltransferase [Bacillus salacetis]|uniref:GNAT family N-acetyltransferase n=1 Tax=Bacillus salacetis TaxID=2315464 RepID=A0A3A1R099_9BACI|nr:GNAT family N-acetyltransferase [Bacillus salacetis]RIW35100.1 GNAT family N-acetyltransferase [Bacillus salacetis]